MTQEVRQVGRGAVSPGLRYTDINAIAAKIQYAREKAQQATELAVADDFQFIGPFLVRPIEALLASGWPLDHRVAYELRRLISSTEQGLPTTDTLDNDIWGSPEPDSRPMFHLVPPDGVTFASRDSHGDARSVYLAAPQAYAVELASTPGSFPDGTYTVTAVDGSFQFEDVTPVDRITNVTYPTPAQRGYFLVFATSDYELHASEQPLTTNCPPLGISPTGGQSNAAFSGFVE